MRNGFIYNADRCVSCKACTVACILENRWSSSGRNIFTFNRETLPGHPVIHLSLACCHCGKPLCLNGCPTGAYKRDNDTSAVIIDSNRCIGCSYCTWNCPYDAPKLNTKTGFIEKCNFCLTRIAEGTEPACTSACPTGALQFGDINDEWVKSDIEWLPEKNINPAVKIIAIKSQKPLLIVPEQTKSNMTLKDPVKSISGEWALVFFTFIILLSVSVSISDFITAKQPDPVFYGGFLILAALLSLFHLRIKHKAFLSILNPKTSPLSREIILFILYSLALCVTLVTGDTTMRIVSVITGLLLLLTIDSVYTFADSSLTMMLNSGQTFLSGLLIISYMSGATYPFIFVAILKMVFTLYMLSAKRSYSLYFTLRIFRAAFLIIIAASIISGKQNDIASRNLIFFLGEFIDRILYYADFAPLNINSEILKKIKTYNNEKKTG
jgi:Fe-S-cluster-containing dehydrogenase component/DMSO reductase anchor subunit